MRNAGLLQGLEALLGLLGDLLYWGRFEQVYLVTWLLYYLLGLDLYLCC